MLSDLVIIENQMNVQRRVWVFSKDKGSGRRVQVKVGKVIVGLEKGDIKDRIKTREVE